MTEEAKQELSELKDLLEEANQHVDYALQSALTAEEALDKVTDIFNDAFVKAFNKINNAIKKG